MAFSRFLRTQASIRAAVVADPALAAARPSTRQLLRVGRQLGGRHSAARAEVVLRRSVGAAVLVLPAAAGETVLRLLDAALVAKGLRAAEPVGPVSAEEGKAAAREVQRVAKLEGAAIALRTAGMWGQVDRRLQAAVDGGAATLAAEREASRNRRLRSPVGLAEAAVPQDDAPSGVHRSTELLGQDAAAAAAAEAEAAAGIRLVGGEVTIGRTSAAIWFGSDPRLVPPASGSVCDHRP